MIINNGGYGGYINSGTFSIFSNSTSSGSLNNTGAYISGTTISGSSINTNSINNWSTGTFIGYNDTTTLDSDTIEFIELILVILGYDIKYHDFCKMSKSERISLLRDIKIKKIID